MDFKKGQDFVMNTYGRYPLVLERGEGSYVYDTDGKKYLDFVAGIAVNSLGHNHKKLVDTISEQASKLLHVSNLYWTSPQMELAEKLVNHYEFDRAFFCNSGAETIEGAMKLVRKYATLKNTDKRNIITMEHSFHGRTYGAVTATGQPKYQKGLEPLMPRVSHVPFNDFDALVAEVNKIGVDKVGGIIVEPVQGEGGIRPADKTYLENIRKFCSDNDIILVFDEVQCGVGRTGKFFAGEFYSVSPDVCCMAKGIAGGVPMGVMMTKQFVADAFSPGDHASTFGGNSLACACANVVYDELTGGLLQNVTKQGELLQNSLMELKKNNDKIVDVRGVGLILGIETTCLASEVVGNAMENGLLLVGAGEKVVRFVPPLNVSSSEIEECVSILSKIL